MDPTDDDELDDDDGGCMCDWDTACAGTGVLHCLGCGGDLCVCVCGGEAECDGCEYCDQDDDGGDYGPDDLDPVDDPP